jgi:hypothetical protein
MSEIFSQNISFSGLKAAYVAGGGTDADGNSNLNDGYTNTEIRLSFFRNAGLSDGTSIPSSGDEISIKDDFVNKTFGSKIITTDKFRAYTNWSSHQNSLKGEAGSSTYTGSTTANKRVRLYNYGQSSSYPYPILLLSPTSTSPYNPGIIVDRSDSNVVDEATVWFRVFAHNPFSTVQMGIVAKDMTLDNWSTQLSYLHNKHGTYCDRLCFHGRGFHNYAGSRDDIISSDYIVSPAYTQDSGSDGTYGSKLTTYFHTRTGKSAGTQRSYNAASTPSLGSNGYFFTNSLDNHGYYRGNTIYANHGLKIKWYETTLQCSLVENSNVIQPVSPPSTWSSSDLTDIFAGMYVYGTGINSSDGAFIAEVHTNYMVMYKQKGSSTTSLVKSLAESDQSSVTLTISGYLYWTLVTTPDTLNSNANYESGNVQILGPPHQVLPKYQASTSSSTPSNEIKEWAYFIGDTTSDTSNYLYYDLRNEEPGGNALSYSVSYSSGTVPLPPELFSSFLEISNRVIDDSTAEDYKGNYDVSETEVPSGGYHHIYIGFKATSSVYYYSDICIAGVQVVDKDNNNKQIWIFNSGTTTDHVWKTKAGTVGIQTATGFPITPSTASSYGNSNYVSLDVNAAYDRASIATGTTSSNTGAADGISGSTTNLVVGNGTMSQSTGTYYVFRETSGTSSLILHSGVVMRSPEIELKQGDKIRVAHLVVSHPSNPQDENDSLYLGVYPIDLTSKFVEISNRFIIDTTTADYTGNYDVSETQVHVSGNHNIYIGIKVTSNTTYYNDVAIAGVQIVNKDNQVQKTWIFNSVPPTSSTDQWQTYTNAVNGSSTPGFPITPQTASGYSYYNMIASASSTIRFSYATSTSSVNTGANDGIATTTNAFPLGDSVISQSSNTYYVYRETSGSTLWSGTVMRSPVYNFTSGDKIRVAHLVVGNSGSQMDPLDTLYLGVY